ncbi:MAG: hypothetical protein Q9177_004560 [Variospora cf. flavescens]
MPPFKDEHVLIIAPGSQTTLAQLGLPESFTPAQLRTSTRMFPAEQKGEWEPLKVRERKVTRRRHHVAPAPADGDSTMADVDGATEEKVNGIEEEETYFEEDPTIEDGAVYPIRQGRVVDWSCLFALMTHIYNTLSPPFHTPIIIITQPTWTAHDHEILTQFFFEKFKTPAFCLMDSALAVCYAYAASTATVVDIGYEKCDISAVVEFLINDIGRGIAVPDCGGEGMTQRLLELLADKDFSRDMCEQLKRSGICEILPPGTAMPGEEVEVPNVNPAAAASAGANAAGLKGRGGPGDPITAMRGNAGVVEAGDEPDGAGGEVEDNEGVLDVASLVVSGKTNEFLARKEKEKAERAEKAAAKKAAQEAAAAPKQAKLPNAKRLTAAFPYTERRPLEELNQNGKRPIGIDASKAEGGAKRPRTPEPQNPAEAAVAGADQAPNPPAEVPIQNGEATALIRREVEVGLERFQAVTGGILDRIADAIHRCILSVPEAQRRQELWDNLIIVGNGSKVRGFKDALVGKLNSKYLISDSNTTIFTSEMPSSFTTPVATGANTPQPQSQLSSSHHGPGVNPLLLAATTASNPSGLIPPGQNQHLHAQLQMQQYQQQNQQASHQHSGHGQTPTRIKLTKMPEYFPEWKDVGTEEASFLGAQVAAKVVFVVDQGLSKGFMSRTEYNDLGPQGIHEFCMPGSLSPPPLKRRRVVSPPTTSSSTTSPVSSIPISPSSNSILQPTPQTLRIYSWNINGIGPYLDTQPPITNFFPTASSSQRKAKPSPDPSLRTCLHRWSYPHLLFLQEIKIAPGDTSSIASLRRTINSPLSNDGSITTSSRLYDAHLCLPRDKHNATGFGGKVYGVCSLIRRDIAASSTTKTVDWDLEGRVLITEIPVDGIVVFNIYAVNGTTNPYRDPASGKVIGDRHTRKRQFHAELRNECARYDHQGWAVVVAGDLNIAQTEADSWPELRVGKEHVLNRKHFKECFMNGRGEGGLEMRDTFREVKGEERKFTYRPRGRVWGEGMDRVDLIMASQRLGVKDADILDDEMERGRSDHVPLWVEVLVGSGNGGGMKKGGGGRGILCSNGKGRSKDGQVE